MEQKQWGRDKYAGNGQAGAGGHGERLECLLNHCLMSNRD